MGVRAADRMNALPDNTIVDISRLLNLQSVGRLSAVSKAVSKTLRGRILEAQRRERIEALALVTEILKKNGRRMNFERRLGILAQIRKHGPKAVVHAFQTMVRLLAKFHTRLYTARSLLIRDSFMFPEGTRPTQSQVLAKGAKQMSDLAIVAESGALSKLRGLHVDSIGDEGVKHLSSAIISRALPSLRDLFLANCGMEDKGMVHLTSAAKSGALRKLGILKVSFNFLTDDSVIGFLSVARTEMPNLGVLDLRVTSIGERTIIVLAKMISEERSGGKYVNFPGLHDLGIGVRGPSFTLLRDACARRRIRMYT